MADVFASSFFFLFFLRWREKEKKWIVQEVQLKRTSLQVYHVFKRSFVVQCFLHCFPSSIDHWYLIVLFNDFRALKNLRKFWYTLSTFKNTILQWHYLKRYIHFFVHVQWVQRVFVQRKYLKKNFIFKKVNIIQWEISYRIDIESMISTLIWCRFDVQLMIISLLNNYSITIYSKRIK